LGLPLPGVGPAEEAEEEGERPEGWASCLSFSRAQAVLVALPLAQPFHLSMPSLRRIWPKRT